MSEPRALPSDLQAYIERGGEVRSDPSAEYAGRCGAAVARPNSTYCQRAAGWGTDHSGVGRCKSHPLESAGLPPWAGEIPASVRRRITGAQAPGPAGRFEPTHGATSVVRSLEELMAENLENSDRSVFFAVPTDDPKRVLDAVTRVLVVALNRAQGHILAIRADYAGRGLRAPADATAGTEALISKLSGSIARCQEARIKAMEHDTERKSEEQLADLLRNLPHEDFIAVTRDPSRLAGFITPSLAPTSAAQLN